MAELNEAGPVAGSPCFWCAAADLENLPPWTMAISSKLSKEIREACQTIRYSMIRWDSSCSKKKALKSFSPIVNNFEHALAQAELWLLLPGNKQLGFKIRGK